MVNDNNEPAPENVPVAAEAVNDIFSGWGHGGVCHIAVISFSVLLHKWDHVGDRDG